MGGKIGDSNPGQNKKSGIVSNQTEILFTHLLWSANKLIPATDMPWCGRPGQTGNGFILKKGDVFQMLSHRMAIAQIMVFFDQAVKQLLGGGSANPPNIDRSDF